MMEANAPAVLALFQYSPKRTGQRKVEMSSAKLMCLISGHTHGNRRLKVIWTQQYAEILTLFRLQRIDGKLRIGIRIFKPDYQA